MGTALKLALAFGAGAAAMYFLEPIVNRRRHAMAHDRAVADSLHARFDDARARHVAGRVQGASAEARARTWVEPVDDERLHARIMSKLGHLVDQPGEVHVEVLDGAAMLSGYVKASELPGLIAAVSAIPGVLDVQSRLTVGRGSRQPAKAPVARH